MYLGKFFVKNLMKQTIFRESIKLIQNYIYTSFGDFLYNHKNDYCEAKKMFRRVIELDPKIPHAHFKLGILHVKHNKDYDSAEAEFRNAIELEPKVAMFHFKLGLLLLTYKQNYKDAEIEFRKTIEIDKNFELAHVNLGLFLRNTLKIIKEQKQSYKAIKINMKCLLEDLTLMHFGKIL